MKILRNLLMSLTLLLLFACSEQSKEREIYTPIYNYFNPYFLWVWQGNGGSAVAYLPDFVNYPNDKTKYGLRGPVESMKTDGYPKSEVAYLDLVFDFNGNLKSHKLGFDKNFKYGEKTHFEYSETGQLKAMGRLYNGNIRSDDYQYYNGRLLKRISGANYYKDYVYDVEGNPVSTKSTQPVRQYAKSDSYTTYFHFSEGNIDTIEICNYNIPEIVTTALRAKMTYEHDADGLCIGAKGEYHLNKSYYKDALLYSVSKMEYNEHHDLAHWVFTLSDNANCGQDDKVFAHVDKSFEYEYDERGNWTTRKSLFTDAAGKQQTVVACRNIEYYSEEILKDVQEREKEINEKPFIGHWSHKDVMELDGGEGTVTRSEECDLCINFYDKSIPVFEGDSEKIWGYINTLHTGLGPDKLSFSVIDKVKIKKNVAQIEYIDGHSGARWSATLTYNPKDKSMTFEDGEQIEQSEDEMYASEHFEPSKVILQFESREP